MSWVISHATSAVKSETPQLFGSESDLDLIGRQCGRFSRCSSVLDGRRGGKGGGRGCQATAHAPSVRVRPLLTSVRRLIAAQRVRSQAWFLSTPR